MSTIDLCLLNLSKRLSFKSFGGRLCHKVNLPSCVARRPLCHKVNLPGCEARRRHFIMTCDIFGTGQTNILGLCYLFRKTYKQPTVAPLKSLKSTYSTKLLHLLRRTIRYHQPSRFFHNDTQFKYRFRCKQSLRLKYGIIKLKPGFHMIATIAVIAAIAKKKNFSDRSDQFRLLQVIFLFKFQSMIVECKFVTC